MKSMSVKTAKSHCIRVTFVSTAQSFRAVSSNPSSNPKSTVTSSFSNTKEKSICHTVRSIQEYNLGLEKKLKKRDTLKARDMSGYMQLAADRSENFSAVRGFVWSLIHLRNIFQPLQAYPSSTAIILPNHRQASAKQHQAH